MKNRFIFSFETKVAVILLVILILVSLTGFFAYKRFSNIISGFSRESRPDMLLVTAKSLENSLSLAENKANSFSLTGDTLYLNSYYEAVHVARQKLNELEELTKYDREFSSAFNLLYSLSEIKFRILDDILIIQNKYRVQEALNKVENKNRC